MTEYYNYVCIGAGISSLMFAYQIKEIKPDASILIFEMGKDINNRKCPIIEKKVDKCANCEICSVVSGVAGAGAYNDGKMIFSDYGANYGGALDTILSEDEFYFCTNRFNYILNNISSYKPTVYTPQGDFKKECIKYDLHLQEAIVKHYGSDGNREIMNSLIGYLMKHNNVKIVSSTEIDIHNIDVGNKSIKYNKEEVNYNRLIIAVGRTGAKWLSKFCEHNSISMSNSRVDVGVRVEIPSEVCEDLSKTIYEPKIYYRTKKYGDIVRSFCWNSGDCYVCMENNGGVLSVNGYANNNTEHVTGNSNFALLNTINFTSPFSMPNEYCLAIASLSNMISGGQVLVQRLGDLKNGKRTTHERLLQSTVMPTLKTAVPGDISLSMPKRILDNIIETLDAFNNVIPGINNYDTLLYSPEVKTYSAMPNFINDYCEIENGVHVIGDCSGITRSIVQAGAMGIYLANKIYNKF